jgi:hypothetical protein
VDGSVLLKKGKAPRFGNTASAAAILSMSKDSVFRLIADGCIKARKWGKGRGRKDGRGSKCKFTVDLASVIQWRERQMGEFRPSRVTES